MKSKLGRGVSARGQGGALVRQVPSSLQIPKPGSGFSTPGSPLENGCLYYTLLRRSARSCPSKPVHLSATTNLHRPGLLVVTSTG
ncbi:hypothetical protein DPMN_042928 [Dreissena polymorpha]|uniref:Uncharacterized protein n=1 Tax=Dreissena polymorpha TaxID=45954 RepID=A0A9D4D0F2_DREPO|nr:hypothetical protein DPMN_042928 [Dreissena polymorpha]